MFITCGEALYDMFSGPSRTGAPLGLTMDGVIGGSPLNVALGLARMGNRAGLFTRLSNDMFGRNIRAFMDDMGIHADYIVTTEQQTTLAMIATREDGQADYSFYTAQTSSCSMETTDIPETVDARDQVIHLGSFAAALPETGQILRSFAKAESANRFIALDPNCRPMVLPDLSVWHTMVDDLLPVANFIKASDEDLEFMYPGQALEAFIDKALEAGAEIVCVTRGPDGALAGNANGDRIAVPGRKISVVDTVGAGDTFQAASLHYIGAAGLAEKGKARNVDLEALVNFAVDAAAVTCMRRGADLPTLDDIVVFQENR